VIIDYVHELIEDENHLIVNKEIDHDNVFHPYNLHKIDVEIEFHHQKNRQAHKAKTNAPNSIQ